MPDESGGRSKCLSDWIAAITAKSIFCATKLLTSAKFGDICAQLDESILMT